MNRASRPYDGFKRALDLTLSLIGLAVSAPIQLAVACMVLIAMGRPILFRQDRPGQNGRVFRLVKFRTMKAPSATRLSDEERLTKTGRFLRATSLDELPSLWNVLKGEMSLVGPRPLLVQYLPLYNQTQARRHEVRPGVTGLAQVRGRNALTWEEKFRLDVEYVDQRSFRMDLVIVIETVAAVFRRSGISQDGHATMPEFLGSRAKEEFDV